MHLNTLHNFIQHTNNTSTRTIAAIQSSNVFALANTITNNIAQQVTHMQTNNLATFSCAYTSFNANNTQHNVYALTTCSNNNVYVTSFYFTATYNSNANTFNNVSIYATACNTLLMQCNKCTMQTILNYAAYVAYTSSFIAQRVAQLQAVA